MLPVTVNVVLAVHRSLCPCIFDCATYSRLAVSVDRFRTRRERSDDNDTQSPSPHVTLMIIFR